MKTLLSLAVILGFYSSALAVEVRTPHGASHCAAADQMKSGLHTETAFTEYKAKKSEKSHKAQN